MLHFGIPPVRELAPIMSQIFGFAARSTSCRISGCSKLPQVGQDDILRRVGNPPAAVWLFGAGLCVGRAHPRIERPGAGAPSGSPQDAIPMPLTLPSPTIGITWWG